MQETEGASYRSTSRFLFEGLEGLFLLVLVFLTWPLSKRWLANWGSRASERARAWPGDRLVSNPAVVFTRGIEIAAPPGRIWPWIVQFGLGRAGFYSYELLERVAGIPVRNVECILPQMQSLRVGDEILVHPTEPGIRVAEVSENSRVCFGDPERSEADAARPDPARSWSIYLAPAGDHSTRLLLRGCVEPVRKPTFPGRLAQLAGQPIDFVMEQRMLRTLRRLVETETGTDGVHRATV